MLAFCEATWDDGDYIASVWDEWLADDTGELLVATVDLRPVALAHVRMVSADEAWIEGVRVDGTLRRRGLGRALTHASIGAARARGAEVLRLFTSSDNTASQRLFTGAGFERVAEFVTYTAQALSVVPRDILPAGARLRAGDPADLDQFWTFLEASTLVPMNGGLLIENWWARELTDALLEHRLAAGDVRVLEAWDTVQALAIIQSRLASKRGPSLVAQYLDGTAESISRMALALRGEAAQAGLERMVVTIPDSLILHDAMDGASYTRHSPEHALWCYALAL